MREERVFVFKKDGVIETLSQEEFQKRVKTFTPSNLSVSAVERYRLFSLRVKLEGKRYSVQVQLRDEEKRIILSGEKSGAATFNNLLKLLGGATVEAILPGCTVSVDEVKRLTISGREIVLVHLTILQEESEDKRLGFAEEKNNVSEAVVQAVIFALKN